MRINKGVIGGLVGGLIVGHIATNFLYFWSDGGTDRMKELIDYYKQTDEPMDLPAMFDYILTPPVREQGVPYRQQMKKVEPDIISQQLMFEHLGEIVNVITHEGYSYWRRLVGVFDGEIMLSAIQDPSNAPHETISQEDIRSFGTKEHGLLQEVNR